MKDFIITDQIKKRVPAEFKEHFLDEWTSFISPTELTDKIEEFEDVGKTMKPKTHFSYQNDKIERKWWPKIPNENMQQHGNGSNRFLHVKKEDHSRDKRQENVFERRKQFHCYECGSTGHFKAQCPKLKRMEAVNRIIENSEDKFLAPYTTIGKIHGVEIPILRDTGATTDVVCNKFVTSQMITGEHVWVKHLLDDQIVCLPLAEVEIDCEMGHIFTKAALISNHLDQGRYILGNQTAAILKNAEYTNKK